MTPDAETLAAAFAKLKRLRRPRMPARLPAGVRPIWRHLASQVAAYSGVTKLDIDALALLIGAAADLQRLETFVKELPAQERRRWYRPRKRKRSLLWEVCQSFLLGPEVLEELTLPNGQTLAALIAGQRPKPQ